MLPITSADWSSKWRIIVHHLTMLVSFADLPQQSSLLRRALVVTESRLPILPATRNGQYSSSPKLDAASPILNTGVLGTVFETVIEIAIETAIGVTETIT
jgi:hypothetical protein